MTQRKMIQRGSFKAVAVMAMLIVGGLLAFVSMRSSLTVPVAADEIRSYTDSKISVTYVDGTTRELPVIFIGIPLAVLDAGKEISSINVAVFLKMSFKEDIRFFDVYRNLTVRFDKSTGETYQWSPLVGKSEMSFASEEIKQVISFVFKSDGIEQMARESVSESIDGDYTLTLTYSVGVAEIVSSGRAFTSLSIVTARTQEGSTATKTVGNTGSSATEYKSGIQDAEEYDQFVSRYEAAEKQYGMVTMFRYAEMTTDPDDPSKAYLGCYEISVINVASDIAKHEGYGFTVGRCP